MSSPLQQHDNYEAVRQAADIYRRSPALTDVDRLAAVDVLADQKLWSMAQICAITGARMSQVVGRVRKTDRTGGKFNPDTLELIVEELEIRVLGQVNDALTAHIVQRGTSPLMLARLLGVEVGRIKTQLARFARQGGLVDA